MITSPEQPLCPPAPERDLAWWIHTLESVLIERLKISNPVKAKAVIHSLKSTAMEFLHGCFKPCGRKHLKKYSDLPDLPTLPEKLADRFPVLWADWQFWHMIRRIAKHPKLAEIRELEVKTYILNKYGLCLDFSPAVWLEMLANEELRAQLFSLMVSTAPQFFPLNHKQDASSQNGSDDPDPATNQFGQLFQRYYQQPNNDHRPGLLLADRSAAELQRVKSAAVRFWEDVQWCEKHRGRFEPRRAPRAAHRTRELKDARRIEDMVEVVRKHPDWSAYKLARHIFGTYNANQRDMASEARRLARYRDQIRVKIYQSRGKKTDRQ